MPEQLSAPYPPLPSDLDEFGFEGGLATLRGNCARMAPRWQAPATVASVLVSPSRIVGVTVPPGSARLLEAMSEYGD